MGHNKFGFLTIDDVLEYPVNDLAGIPNILVRDARASKQCNSQLGPVSLAVAKSGDGSVSSPLAPGIAARHRGRCPTSVGLHLD